MYIYFISSDTFGENIHKLIHSEEKREVVDMIKSHQLLYRTQFDIKELTVDINLQGYTEFLKNIDCYKGLDRFYKFDANLEEFKNLLEAYCTFNSKLSKFSTEEEGEETPRVVEISQEKYLEKHFESMDRQAVANKAKDNYQNKFADVDLKNSRVSYIYDDKADTILAKQLFGDKVVNKVGLDKLKWNNSSKKFESTDKIVSTVLNDIDSLRDDDHTNVLKEVKQMTEEEWEERSKEMNEQVNEDGSTANLLGKSEEYEEESDFEEDPQRVIALVNNMLLAKRIIYFEEDEIKIVDHEDFNEFKILEKFLIPENDMIISIIMYKLQRYLDQEKNLTVLKVAAIIKKAELLVEDSSDDEEDKTENSYSTTTAKNYVTDLLKGVPPLKMIKKFMDKHCAHVSGNKEQAKIVFNRFGDYIYENGLTIMSKINKSTFTKVLKNHFPYRRFSSGMYWVDMKLIE